MTRISYIDASIGPKLPIPLVAEVLQKNGATLSLHANKIATINIHVAAQYKSKSKEEEAIRNGAHLNCLVELDLSSNCLHQRYEPTIGSSFSCNFLGILPNLQRLNLASNGLNEAFFAELIGSNCLMRLHTLDISNNQFTKLPSDVDSKALPRLKHLLASRNQISSLTALLQQLHKFGGKLESVQFLQNQVCSKPYYHEKLVFVLGLKRLDGKNISSEERKRARFCLENELSVAGRTSPAPSQHSAQPQHDKRAAEQGRVECEVDAEASQQRLEIDDHHNQKIQFLEEKIAILSSRIEQHVALNEPEKSSKDARSKMERKDCSTQTTTEKVMERSQARIHTLESTSRVAAASLLKSVLMRKLQMKSNATLLLAFSLWATATKFSLYEHRVKTKYTNLQKNWQAKAASMVSEAVNEEAKRANEKLDTCAKATRTLSDKTAQLKEANNDLEARLLESERRSRLQMENIEATLSAEKCARSKEAHEARIESDRLRGALKIEQDKRSTLESEKCEAKDQLDKLKLEARQKDATIQRLKEAYEKAADTSRRQARCDKSNLEQALEVEQKVKEELQKLTSELNDARAEIQCQTEKHRAREIAMQNEINASAAKLLQLESEVDRKDRKIGSLQRKMRSSEEDHDEIESRLVDAKRRNNQLRSLLEKTTQDDIRRANRSSFDRQQLEIEVSKNVELEEAMNELQASSGQKELSLQAQARDMQQENAQLKNELQKREASVKNLRRKLETSQHDTKLRQRQMAKEKAVVIQELRDRAQRELAYVRKELEAERAMRLELTKKAELLKADNHMQKIKMQSAVEDMAKQLLAR